MVLSMSKPWEAGAMQGDQGCGNKSQHMGHVAHLHLVRQIGKEMAARDAGRGAVGRSWEWMSPPTPSSACLAAPPATCHDAHPKEPEMLCAPLVPCSLPGSTALLCVGAEDRNGPGDHWPGTIQVKYTILLLQGLAPSDKGQRPAAATVGVEDHAVREKTQVIADHTPLQDPACTGA